MDPPEWIQWTQSPNLAWRVKISLVFLYNGSIGHNVQWTTLPMDIMSNGRPLDMMDPMDPLD